MVVRHLYQWSIYCFGSNTCIWFTSLRTVLLWEFQFLTWNLLISHGRQRQHGFRSVLVLTTAVTLGWYVQYYNRQSYDCPFLVTLATPQSSFQHILLLTLFISYDSFTPLMSLLTWPSFSDLKQEVNYALIFAYDWEVPKQSYMQIRRIPLPFDVSSCLTQCL